MEFNARIVNNTLNVIQDGISVSNLLAKANSCVEIVGNSISAGAGSSGIRLLSLNSASLNSTLSNNQIRSGGVLVTIAGSGTQCLEMFNNNVPGGYNLINTAGSVFNLGPIVDNVGPITTTGTFTPIGECPTCGGLGSK